MTMQPITTHAWEKRELKEALARFAKHQIVSSSPGRWYVRAPDSRNLAYEVTVQSGRVLVDGDIDPIGFAGGSGWDSPEEYVAWIGRHDSDVEYAAGKAGRWWGSMTPMHEREAEVMLFDLGWRIERMDEDLGPPEDDEDAELVEVRAAVKRIDEGEDFDDVTDYGRLKIAKSRWAAMLKERATIREAMRRVRSGEYDGLELLPHWLYEELDEPDTEWLSGLGEVVSRRVIVGVAALAHLHALLSAEKAKAAAAATTAVAEGTETR